MTAEKTELATQAFAAFERRDLDAIEQLCHPDIEFDWSRRLLDPVVFRGYDGVRGFFEEIDTLFDEVTFDVEEALEFGDRVLIVSTGRFRGRASGVEVTARAANVWTVRDGKLASFRFYQSKDDALADLEREGVDLRREAQRG